MKGPPYLMSRCLYCFFWCVFIGFWERAVCSWWGVGERDAGNPRVVQKGSWNSRRTKNPLPWVASDGRWLLKGIFRRAERSAKRTPGAGQPQVFSKEKSRSFFLSVLWTSLEMRVWYFLAVAAALLRRSQLLNSPWRLLGFYTRLSLHKGSDQTSAESNLSLSIHRALEGREASWLVSWRFAFYSPAKTGTKVGKKEKCSVHMGFCGSSSSRCLREPHETGVLQTRAMGSAEKRVNVRVFVWTQPVLRRSVCQRCRHQLCVPTSKPRGGSWLPTKENKGKQIFDVCCLL